MKWKLIHTGLLSAGMSGLVALIVTIVNTGFDGGLLQRWFFAWCLAFPVAWLAAIFWGPAAHKIACKITDPPPQP